MPTEVLALGFESVFFVGVCRVFLGPFWLFSPFCPSFGPLSGGVGENARRALPSRLSLLKRDQAREIDVGSKKTETSQNASRFGSV